LYRNIVKQSFPRVGETNKTINKPRINSQIIAQELRVIDESGKNLGVLGRNEALALVRPDSGIDLIEISPNAKPPVARLMSYDKYRYEAAKREKKERLAQKGGGVKEVQISARAATNDLLIKTRQLEKFLTEGHQVEIHMRLRGREKYNRDWARKKLNDFMKMITTEYRVTNEPKFGGRGMLMQITKK
jgi:translation initiation factor IF-3